MPPTFVIPAKAGTHSSAIAAAEPWVPAFAGMTILGRSWSAKFPDQDTRAASDQIESLSLFVMAGLDPAICQRSPGQARGWQLWDDRASTDPALTCGGGKFAKI